MERARAKTCKFEKIPAPIDKYFYSSEIIMIMLKMAMDAMCAQILKRNKRVEQALNDEWANGANKKKERKITHFINPTVEMKEWTRNKCSCVCIKYVHNSCRQWTFNVHVHVHTI